MKTDLVSSTSFDIIWFGSWNLEKLNQCNLYGNGRIVCITSKTYRVIIEKTSTGLSTNGFHFQDSHWQKKVVNVQNKLSISLPVPTSYDSLTEYLEFCMLKCFPDSPELFTDYHISVINLRQLVVQGITTQELESKRIAYTFIQIETSTKWDGCIKVVCSSDSVAIPYKETEEGNVLLSRYFTVIPEYSLLYFCRQCYSFIERVIDWLENIHWSNIRCKL